MSFKIVFICITIFLQTSSYGTDKVQIFNEKRDGFFFPVKYYFNGSFDVIQNPEWFQQDDYRRKHQEVYNRIKNPDKSIRRDGGYGKFFRDEFLSSRVIPNIGLHTMGASYDSYWLTQYFEYYNYPIAPLWTLLTTYATHLGNEALETSHEEITSHDHIADLYVFDVLGFVLSTKHEWIEFLTQDLGMRAWHGQPIWDVSTDNVFNPGLNYIYRPEFLKFSNYAPIIHTGMQNMGGLSMYQGERTHSLLAGIALTNPLKQKGRFVIGYYFERNDELVASVLLNSGENMRYKVNLYPNFSPVFIENKYLQKLSLVFGQTRARDYLLGFNFNLPIGLGKGGI
ncbi:hypothetical protein [Bacteriovorax sp. Seq25_V]|uniref:hypothetical protein n=1 Tax=Bacteriovorax sp. Seq25_V TaxID=1201288 RepID=UPI00038A19E3|nr:hypothetical protein [Bacteriovorax sp. Seq25_V]EQC48003.1 hypothetical protein M900_A0047 [Bacteriovorax sp. Seq25_V]